MVPLCISAIGQSLVVQLPVHAGDLRVGFGYLVFAPRFPLVTSSDLRGLGCVSIRNTEVVYRVTPRALGLTDHSTYPSRECVFFSSTTEAEPEVQGWRACPAPKFRGSAQTWFAVRPACDEDAGSLRVSIPSVARASFAKTWGQSSCPCCLDSRNQHYPESQVCFSVISQLFRPTDDPSTGRLCGSTWRFFTHFLLVCQECLRPAPGPRIFCSVWGGYGAAQPPASVR